MWQVVTAAPTIEIAYEQLLSESDVEAEPLRQNLSELLRLRAFVCCLFFLSACDGTDFAKPKHRSSISFLFRSDRRIFPPSSADTVSALQDIGSARPGEWKDYCTLNGDRFE
jgi:hypothetical protein